MSGRDAFGLEKDDFGAREDEEMQLARRIPPAFCWTEDEYRDYLHGYISEGELRSRHAQLPPEYDPAEDADSELTGGTAAPPEGA